MKPLKLAAQFLFPSGLTCVCCDEPTYGENLCMDCVRQLLASRITEPLCPDCGEPLGDEPVCPRCEKFGVLHARSVWRHELAARTLVHQLKFGGVLEALTPMCDCMAETVRQMRLPEDTIITCVTMPKHRLKERGIDHTLLLTEGIAQRLNMPFRALLTRVNDRKMHTQQGLSAEERMLNVQHTFRCNEPISQPVLLVDDVLTTGATAADCQRALLEAGAPAVFVISATRGGQKDG